MAGAYNRQKLAGIRQINFIDSTQRPQYYEQLLGNWQLVTGDWRNLNAGVDTKRFLVDAPHTQCKTMERISCYSTSAARISKLHQLSTARMLVHLFHFGDSPSGESDVWIVRRTREEKKTHSIP